ncbi:LutC/YkgG family protein [Magnetospirillum sulfuroxidans]|uniref:Lactate utilization protein n=1 Tax=Magnetospirillum sulfuroxidans TaxID=611300 RepID=A0ABS5IBZ6_9PROT|nr:lactate utilization protein [Magnetospirillum sulfuroxidans]MBR9971951.1 lactate utilization protein [Magnetospirillum sulfuroxidans]
MSDARAAILSRLRAAPQLAPPEYPDWQPPRFGNRLERFRIMLEAVHGEVYEVAADQWRERLRAILSAKGVNKVMAAPHLGVDWPEILAYDRPVEDLKELLVDGIDAAVTTTRGAIAETGTLVLWPDVDEPRLLSLLPPIHVALLNQADIADTLAEMMTAQNWAATMPTNVLLISGPSKTADIEQTLAYGVHGPKQLIVLVLQS